MTRVQAIRLVWIGAMRRLHLGKSKMVYRESVDHLIDCIWILG